MVELIKATVAQKVNVKVVLEDEDGLNYSFVVETKWSEEMELDEIAEEIRTAISRVGE